MPSKSKAQQRFFGMVDAYKKGEMKNASSKIKKAADGMSMSDVKDFAETKHKGLPEKVEENIIKLTESDIHNLVKNIILEIGRSSYTQKKYDQETRNEIISNAQSEVDRLRAEITSLTQKIKIARSPEAVEQLSRQRNILYGLRNRAVAKVWNLSHERVMTQGAKDRAASKRRNGKMSGKNIIRFSPEDVPMFTESDLHRIVKESVDTVMANLNRLNNKPQQPIEKKEEVPENYIYSVKELQWMYDNQDKLNEFERKVLNAEMWVRARMANYHGYTKEWYNIAVINGEIFYYENGKLEKIPSWK